MENIDCLYKETLHTKMYLYMHPDVVGLQPQFMQQEVVEEPEVPEVEDTLV